MVELRPYQKQAIESVKNRYALGDTATLLVCATGTGKTTIFGEIARRTVENDRNVLVLAHREELIDQAVSRLSEMCGVEAEIEKAERHYSYTSPLCVASVQSLQGGRLDALRKGWFGLTVIDEAHHSIAPTYKNIIEHVGGHLLGVTATADRADKRGLAEVYDSIAYEYPIARAVAEGYLSPIKAKCIPLKMDLRKVKVSHGDFQANDLGDALEPYLADIAKVMATECAYRKTVCFLPLVKTAEKMAEELNRAGLSAVCVSGYDSSERRAEVLEGFKSGRYDVIANSMLLCLDMETEILTARGFVGPDEIREDDLVANWNFDGSVFFEKPHEIVKRQLYPSEHMVSVDSKRINFRVTNTHRMIVAKGAGRRSWKKIPAQELHNRHVLPSCGIAEPLDIKPEQEANTYTKHSVNNCVYRLVNEGHSREDARRIALERAEKRSSLRFKNPSDLTVDECRFIGFWIADGTKTRLSSGGVEYVLAQSCAYPKICAWIDNIIRRCGFDSLKKVVKPATKSTNCSYKWSFPRGTGRGSQERNGLYPIEPYLDKNGSDLLWGLDEAQFDALIEGFWYGDGTHGQALDGVPSHIHATNTNKKLIDTFCAIGSIRGWNCSVSVIPQKNPKHNTQYGLTMIKGQKIYLSHRTEVKHEEFKQEKVWCVRTTSKNIITRRHGKVTVMGNTEGWDCPEVDCVVMLRPTKSRGLYSQCIGRGTRIADGKDHLLLLDFLWMTEKHDLCRPASLLGREADVSKRMTEIIEDDDEAKDLFGVAEQAESDVIQQREESLAKELAKQRRKKSKLVDPLQFATSIQDLDLMNYRPTFAWECDMPTDSQRKALEKMGIATDGISSKGQASALIDSLMRRIDSSLASPKQIRLLEKYGFVHVGTWSKEAASKMISRISMNRWMVPRSVVPAAYDPREDTA